MSYGRIMKALSGFYYVRPDDAPDALVQCRARGVFKKKGITPLVGDRCRFERGETGEGTVTEILPRSTELIRPPVANADTAVLVFSITNPDLNLLLLDKFLVHTEHAGLDNIICLSKTDLAGGALDAAREAAALYTAVGYPVLFTSAVTAEGIDLLTSRLTGRFAVVAGQSGVGKSSLLNAMLPGIQLATGEVSIRLGRGRHTTRHVELISLPNGAVIADTPGFSQLDFAGIEPEHLSACFIDFAPFAEACKFRGCTHRREPGCAVREAVEDGRIASSRYAHYGIFFDELQERKRRY
jgi:ribosome biogenesis GTPase